MNLFDDKRVVMTLDAGGTNFVFSAIRGGENIVEPITLPSNGDNLEKSLANMVDGFSRVKEELQEEPVAISFAFPGPADYPNGIIGDLVNLPGYRGGVALGPFLEEKFNLPVYINNDGDLYAYGEALGGFLPEINKSLEDAGSPKRYHNLVGITLGTGLGGGLVREGKLFIGDNAMAAEIYAYRNKLNPNWCAEDGVSIRAVKRHYGEYSGDANADELTPKDIFEIAKGMRPGNSEAAVKAFASVGESLGDVLTHLATTFDGLIVIGGGLSGAAELIMPSALDEMNGTLDLPNGGTMPRLVQKVVSADTEEGLSTLLNQKTAEIKVPQSDKTVVYNPEPMLAIGISRIGASRAISLGAYAFALDKLDA